MNVSLFKKGMNRMLSKHNLEDDEVLDIGLQRIFLVKITFEPCSHYLIETYEQLDKSTYI